MKPIILLTLATIVATASVFPAVAQSVGTMLPKDKVPTYIPEHHRLTWYDAYSLPSGWGAAVQERWSYCYFWKWQAGNKGVQANV